jgi:hypothetical protein
MATDIPENLAQATMALIQSNLVANNRDGQAISTTALGVLQVAAARNFDELGVTESRANSGLIATPFAGPTTKAPD